MELTTTHAITMVAAFVTLFAVSCWAMLISWRTHRELLAANRELADRLYNLRLGALNAATYGQPLQAPAPLGRVEARPRAPVPGTDPNFQAEDAEQAY